jgi:hypothetical protein
MNRKRAVEDCGEVRPLHLERHLPGVDARNVDEVIDQSHLQIDLSLDRLERARILFSIENSPP